MLRQITLIKFKESVTKDNISAMGAGFAGISSVVDGIRRFEFGPDLKLMDGTFDYALVIDFESESVWKAYLEHPDHVAFAQRFSGLAEKAVRAQYSV